ncbi:MAG: hypothetical protein OXD50_09430 [Chloroflexi bacterium]|nr:hypothetical protein [Chloroflexota bacterium]
MPAVGTWRHVITATLLLLGLVLLILGVRVIRAQEDSQTERQPSPDHYYYQFFGYAADVTIDGEPLQVGDSITPILNGNAVTPAVVAENGFFLTFKHLYQEPPIGECQVVYEIHSQQRAVTVTTEEFAYARGCGDIQVAVAIATTTGGSSNGAQAEAVSEPGSIDGSDDSVGSSQPEAANGSTEEVLSDSLEDDTLEDDATAPTSDSEHEDGIDEADHADDDDSGVQAEAPETSSGVQRPDAPRTGTGGVYVRETTANWPVVAGVLALLVFAIGLMTVMVKRRTDESPH